MERSAILPIGVEARSTDGVCGHVTKVVFHPVHHRVTHLVVEPEHRQGLGRLVPVDLAEIHGEHLDLRCTTEEFERLEFAEEVELLDGVEGIDGYNIEEVLVSPYFGGNATTPVVTETLPVGEVAIRRGDAVHASDGSIGELEGLVVDAASLSVSHFLLKEGHLFSRKDVAIPVSAVGSIDGNGVNLSISRHDVNELPAVDLGPSGG